MVSGGCLWCKLSVLSISTCIDQFTRKQITRGVGGSLCYLVTFTRPDLAWSYSELSKYVQFPKQSHMEASERILRYLRATVKPSITPAEVPV